MEHKEKRIRKRGSKKETKKAKWSRRRKEMEEKESKEAGSNV
jgi:hypothetical protein